MTLKSTNIWDDVRADYVEGEDPNQHGRYRGVRSSRTAHDGSDDTSVTHGSTVTNSQYANRHGISMKSLTKTRKQL